MSMLDDISHCIFCNKAKSWDSNIRITDNQDRLIFKATVCGECKKKYSISDLFARYSQLVEAEYEANQK